jgi:pimeloyl-ACP methyl ester carboxylesterase
MVHAQAPPIFRNALHACRSRLADEGVDPRSYNTTESANDLEALRKALDVRRWNLLAISADGSLGLTYMRMFPRGIRSAIIDSGSSTNVLWGLDADRGWVEMLEKIFAGCRANASCNAAYPGIRGKFYRLVRQLNREPLVLTIADYQPEPITLPIDGSTLLLDTMSLIFPGDAWFEETIHLMLELMWFDIHGGLEEDYRIGIGTGPTENGHGNDFLAYGKTLSYECQDLIGFVTWRDRVQAARDMPAFTKRYLDRDYDLGTQWVDWRSPAGCRAWRVGVADRVLHEPVHSRIPTLVLAGEYDLGLPAYMVRPMVPTLKNSTYVEMPAASHLQLASYTNGSGCARAMADAFLTHPHAEVDTSCVDDLPRFDFTPPDGSALQGRQMACRPPALTPWPLPSTRCP